MKLLVTATTLAAALALAAPAFAKGPKHGAGGFWKQIDANQDGKVEKSEFDAHRTARFEAADLDGDGKLTFEETEAAREKRRMERRKARFDAMDRDGDGVLSEAEVNRLSERMWIRTDLDDDDVVTRREMRRRGEEMREMWRERRGDKRRAGDSDEDASPRPRRE